MVSEPLTPAIKKFLEEWERTKGYGMHWELSGEALRGNFYCCPLTAPFNEHAFNYESCLAGRMSLEEAHRVVRGADVSYREPEIRARLLKAVGLA